MNQEMKFLQWNEGENNNISGNKILSVKWMRKIIINQGMKFL